MKRSWIKKIVGGLSFTTALFVFQACYGSPQDFGMDFYIKGTVKSKTSGLPIKGIKVSTPENYQYQLTDESGWYGLFTTKADSIKIRFEDIDSEANGLYQNKDTILTGIKSQAILDVYLANK